MHSYDTRKATDLAEVLFDGIESTREFWYRFLLCVNIIEDLTFENQQKILHPEDYRKWEAHRNFSGAAFKRVSTVGLEGEGK